MDKHIDPFRLEKKHLQNCKLLPDRYEILNLMPEKAVVAEIGVLGGDFSESIIAKTKPNQLYLIDSFNGNDWASNDPKRFNSSTNLDFIKKRFQNLINKKTVHLKQGISWEVLSQFEDNSFDWIYIDGDHRYIGVSNDLKQAKRVIKPDGYIVVNDYIFYSHWENQNYGVIHAVNELCVQDNFEMAYFALHPQMYCDVVLKRIK